MCIYIYMYVCMYGDAILHDAAVFFLGFLCSVVTLLVNVQCYGG